VQQKNTASTFMSVSHYQHQLQTQIKKCIKLNLPMIQLLLLRLTLKNILFTWNLSRARNLGPEFLSLARYEYVKVFEHFTAAAASADKK
jgi:hypothetical protein